MSTSATTYSRLISVTPQASYTKPLYFKIKRIGHQIVGTEQDHIIVTEFPAQGVKIHVGAVHIAQFGVMLIVPPCGRIENDFLSIGSPNSLLICASSSGV